MDSCVDELILAARKLAVAVAAVAVVVAATMMAVVVARATVMIFDYICVDWMSSISKERPSNHQAHTAPGIVRFRSENFGFRNSLAFSRELQVPVSCRRSVYGVLV